MEENTSAAPTPIQNNPPKEIYPLPSSKKGAKTLLITAVIFMVIGTIATAFYLYSNPVLQPTPTNSPNPTITRTPDPTADWQAYEGDNFSFKYPEKIFILEKSDKNDLENYKPQIEHVVIFTKAPPEVNGEYIPDTINVGVYDNSNQVIDPVEILNIDMGIEKLIFDRNNLQPIEFGGGMGYKIERPQNYSNFSGRGIQRAYLIQNNKIFLIDIEPYDLELANQILSTFKFNDPQTPNTSDWLTYTDPEFTLKYPPTWELEGKNLITIRETTKKASGDFTPGNARIQFGAPLGSIEEAIQSTPGKESELPTTLDGVKGIQISGYEGIAGTVFYSTVYLETKLGAFFISFTTQDPDAIPVEEFNQILSTLKYTN